MKKTKTFSCDKWIYDWCEAQKKGGYNVSRLIVKAIINYYHLAPPNIKNVKQKIKENWNK